MAVLLTQFQFLNDNGDPLSAGKIYTYEAGSSTPATTYQDSAETTPQANPIVLGADGRPPGDAIWLDASQSYKLVIKDSNDATVQTIDNVSAGGNLFAAGIQLGGNLDTNNYSIVSNSNYNITIAPHGTGYTDIKNFRATTNVDLNGYDLIVDDGQSIVDENTNQQITFNTTVSAVNNFAVTNAATGNHPIWTAVGDDTNINYRIAAKGTGTIELESDTNVTGEISSTTLSVSGASTFSTDVTLDGVSVIVDDGEGLHDSNGNELLVTTKTASAVNHIEITNAATSNGPTISADGDDTNIDLNMSAKGTGQVVVNDSDLNVEGEIEAKDTVAVTSTVTPAGINLYEQSSSGSNYIRLSAPNTLSSNITIGLPTSIGTNKDFLQVNSTGQLIFKSLPKTLVSYNIRSGAATTSNLIYSLNSYSDGDTFSVEGRIIPDSDGVNLNFVPGTAIANGTGTLNYISGTTVSSSSASSFLAPVAINVGNGSGEGAMFEFTFCRLSSTTCFARGTVSWVTSGSVCRTGQFSGVLPANNLIYLGASSGTISGHYTIYNHGTSPT